jgi:hypothetical protein
VELASFTKEGISDMPSHRILPAVVLLLAVTAAACTDDGSTAATVTTSTEPTTPSPSADATTSPSSVTTPSPEPVIEDGKHFVFVKKGKAGDPDTLTFDLAIFLTGHEAEQAAAEAGDEVPVPNDVYIINDNPKLRTVPLAPTAKILLLKWSQCCDVFVPVDFERFAGYLTDPTNDFHGTLSPYWVRVQGGQIVKVQEQYLP